MMTPLLEQRLGVGIEAIRTFCEKWGIVDFALFGSVVRDDFGSDSDIDVMVLFDPERISGLRDRFVMQDEFEALFGGAWISSVAVLFATRSRGTRSGGT